MSDLGSNEDVYWSGCEILLIQRSRVGFVGLTLGELAIVLLIRFLPRYISVIFVWLLSTLYIHIM